MTEELTDKIEHFSKEIKIVEIVDDIVYIRIKDVEYGLKDLSGNLNLLSAIEESKQLTKEQKYKEFRKIIPSYEPFKNLVIENKGLVIIKGIFYIDMRNYISKPVEANFYLERINVEPKYWNAGITDIIYSYIERFIKDLDYESIYIAEMGRWQTINFYIKEGFFPIDELDYEYIIPLLKALNMENIAVTDETGDLYIMLMHKYIGSRDLFLKFEFLLASHLPSWIPFLKDKIYKDQGGRIRMLVADVVHVFRMIGYDGYESSIYWGLKYVLFHAGIVVTTGYTIDNQLALIMRIRTEGDVLPENFMNIES